MKKNKMGIGLALLAFLTLALARPAQAKKLSEVKHIVIIYQGNPQFRPLVRPFSGGQRP